MLSVEATQDGQVRAHFTSRHSNGAGIKSTHYVDGVAGGGGGGRSRGFPFTSPKDSSTTMFHLNPERIPVSGSFTNSELFGRLLIRVGETKLFHTGETFSLYDFTAGGKRYYCVYRVIARDEPDEAFDRQR